MVGVPEGRPQDYTPHRPLPSTMVQEPEGPQAHVCSLARGVARAYLHHKYRPVRENQVADCVGTPRPMIRK